MASHIVQFAGLSDRDRKKVSRLPKLAEGDHVELHVRRSDGQEQTVSLPPAAVSVVGTLLARLISGERVAVLAEDQELSPPGPRPSSASRARSSSTAWTSAICRSAMSASIVVPRSRTSWR